MDKAEKLEVDMLEVRMQALGKMLYNLSLEMEKLDRELLWWQLAALVLGAANVGWAAVVLGGLL